MYAEVYLTLLTCCFSIDIYSFLYRTQVNSVRVFVFLYRLPPAHPSMLSPLFPGNRENGRLADVEGSTFKYDHRLFRLPQCVSPAPGRV